MRLLESSAPRRRTRGGTAVSILVHVGIIGAAVVGTAKAGIPDRPEVEVALPVYVAPAPETPVAPTTGPATVSHSTGPVRATLPSPPAFPSIEPVGIPPVVPGLDPARGLEEQFTRGGVGQVATEGAAATSGDGPWAENLVERAALPLGQVHARYPDALRSQGLGGRAVLRFVVDTLGRVEPGTVQLVSATHPLFGDAARRAIDGLRFRPAEARGHRVRQLVELPFEFRIE